jgi:hypothetical protein
MTPAQIDSRLTVLETRISPEEAPTIFVKFLSSLNVPVDGWDCEGATYWRLSGESDDCLFTRVKEAIGQMPGVIKLRQMQRESY